MAATLRPSMRARRISQWYWAWEAAVKAVRSTALSGRGPALAPNTRQSMLMRANP